MADLPATDLRKTVLTLAVPGDRLPAVGYQMRALLPAEEYDPGFGGQEFIHETLPKIQQADAWRRERNLAYCIGVDGGINFQTAAECARAGADVFVSGTALFGQRNLKAAVKKMRQIVTAARTNIAPSPAAITVS